MLEQETLEVPAAAAAESTAKAKRESAKPSRAVEPHLLSADEIEVLYIEHRTLLLFIASRKFHIADGEAENLIQDVFLSFLQTCTRIDNVRSWLVAAMCNASRHFWRAQGRTESLPDDYANACDPKTWGTAEEHAMRLTMSKVVG
ncbi:MAG TPA: sigma factor, partial [Thermoanaerobaculia bacterium]|nr:sigma factor [Thermoanaerobaculia bacterium]